MKKIIAFVVAALLCCRGASGAEAAEDCRVLKSFYSEKELGMYIRVPGESMEISALTVDGNKAEADVFRRLDEGDQIKTLFAVHSSVTGDERCYQPFLDVLRGILSDSSANESFALLSLSGDKVTEESEVIKNQMQLFEAAEALSEDTVPEDDAQAAEEYFAENLSYDEGVFERLVVFTDAETINSSELDYAEDSRMCPVYFVVIDSKGTALMDEKLTSLPCFGGYYICPVGADYKTIPELINDFSDIFFMKTTLSDELVGKGGQKRVCLALEGGGVFASLEETIDTGDYRDEVHKKSLGDMKKLAVMVSLAACGLAAALVFVLRKNKTTESVSEEKPAPHYTVPLAEKNQNSDTVITSASTRLLFKESGVYRIVLTESGNPENVIELSSEKEAVLGRNESVSDFVIKNERSVSKRHCRIFSRSDGVYVEDLESLNHTFVDGEKITGETKLFTGSVLKLGRMVFDVKIIEI